MQLNTFIRRVAARTPVCLCYIPPRKWAACMLSSNSVALLLPHPLPPPPQVVAAQGLCPSDRVPSPYCVLCCGPGRWRTAAVRRSLDPEWGEEFLLEFQQVGGAGACVWAGGPCGGRVSATGGHVAQ